MGLPAVSNQALVSPPSLHEVPALAPPAARPARGHLIGPAVDFWLLGGLSLAFLFFCHAVMKSEGPGNEASWFIFNLSFAVNFPHFLSSYHMLYGDFRKEIRRRARYLWAAVVVPSALFAAIAFAVTSRSEALLGYLVQAMFFFVGWHYAKQTFGVMVVTNALRKVFYTKWERHLIKANLLLLWMVSWTRFAVPSSQYDFQQLKYSGLGLAAPLATAALYGAVISSVVVVGLHFLKYIREGKTPAPGAVAGWAAFHAWYLPAFAHPAFMLLIPFFHSMQYLIFVVAFRHHKAKAAAGTLADAGGRLRYVKGVWGELLMAAATGAVFMWFMPTYMDRMQIAAAGWNQPSLFYNCFTIFINVHHYFIDNVLWRSDNEEMREHLFG